MAFGHEDTDDLYERSIFPVLEALEIKTIRVDRSDKNDDIDDQIIQGLNTSHFCISDLTYARPSVYFEAGYANGRGLPVVFTCRGDHFTKGQPEDLRVHFDLQMKPIIAWDGGRLNATEFEKKLTKRIQVITAPIRQLARQNDELKTWREAWKKNAPANRALHCSKVFVSTLEDLIEHNHPERGHQTHHQYRMGFLPDQEIDMFGLEPGFMQFVRHISEAESFSKPRLDREIPRYADMIFRLMKTYEVTKAHAIEVLITQRQFRTSPLPTVMQQMAVHDAPVGRSYQIVQGRGSLVLHLEVLVLDKIQSEPEFDEQARQLAAHIKARKTEVIKSGW